MQKNEKFPHLLFSELTYFAQQWVSLYPDAGIKRVMLYRFKATNYIKIQLLRETSKFTISKKYIVVFEVQAGQHDEIECLLHAVGRYSAMPTAMPQLIRDVAGFESVYNRVLILDGHDRDHPDRPCPLVRDHTNQPTPIFKAGSYKDCVFCF